MVYSSFNSKGGKYMDLQEIREGLKRHPWKEVAENTGISYDVIRSIAKGHTERPAYQDIIKIISFLESNEGTTNENA